MLGVPTGVGLEIMADACASSVAAGHATIRCDIASYPVRRCDVLIASPPCQTLSMAGKGEGRQHLGRIAEQVARGDWDETGLDDRTRHLLVVGRWIDGSGCTTVMLEQVRAALPVWKAYARLLRSRGWSAWTGILNSADYGVPQTRERAILIASCERKVSAPSPTHRKGGGSDLFGELQPWVTMAEACGWGLAERPANTLVTRDSGGGTPGEVLDGGSGSRRMHQREKERGAWVDTRGDNGRESDSFDPEAMPSRVITSKSNSWRLRPGKQPNRSVRGTDEPAPTLCFGHDAASWEWELDRRQQSNGVPVPTVTDDRPAPTLTGIAGAKSQWVRRRRVREEKHESDADWWNHRPATTIAGDPRAFAPGGHMANDGRNNDAMVGRSENAIKLSVAEALALQSFRPDLPLCGSETSQFLQIGNAIPPRLAAHVAAMALGVVPPK